MTLMTPMGPPPGLDFLLNMLPEYFASKGIEPPPTNAPSGMAFNGMKGAAPDSSMGMAYTPSLPPSQPAPSAPQSGGAGMSYTPSLPSAQNTAATLPGLPANTPAPPAMGGSIGDALSPVTGLPLGVSAPPAPEVPRVGTPGVPQAAQGPDIMAIMRMIAGGQNGGAVQRGPLLADLLYKRG